MKYKYLELVNWNRKRTRSLGETSTILQLAKIATIFCFLSDLKVHFLGPCLKGLRDFFKSPFSLSTGMWWSLIFVSFSPVFPRIIYILQNQSSRVYLKQLISRLYCNFPWTDLFLCIIFPLPWIQNVSATTIFFIFYFNYFTQISTLLLHCSWCQISGSFKESRCLSLWEYFLSWRNYKKNHWNVNCRYHDSLSSRPK